MDTDTGPVDADILAELAPDRLLLAYAHGAFPMVEGGELMWFCPDPRGLLPLDDRLHVPRRLGQRIRSGRFVCTFDRCFAEVMRLCGERPGEDEREGTWISPEIHLAYRRLHELGHAHSVEAWPAGRVGEGSPGGGAYGVALGGAFFAESMFHTATDAGKVALVHLLRHLGRRGFAFCDVQWTTDHLETFGAYERPSMEYLAELHEALARRVAF